jgi:hypothetical protein
MTLLNPNLPEFIADELRLQLDRRVPLGNALRTLAGTPPRGLIFLCQALRIVLEIDNRESARIIAREVTLYDDGSRGAFAPYRIDK